MQGCAEYVRKGPGEGLERGEVGGRGRNVLEEAEEMGGGWWVLPSPRREVGAGGSRSRALWWRSREGPGQSPV